MFAPHSFSQRQRNRQEFTDLFAIKDINIDKGKTPWNQSWKGSRQKYVVQREKEEGRIQAGSTHSQTENATQPTEQLVHAKKQESEVSDKIPKPKERSIIFRNYNKSPRLATFRHQRASSRIEDYSSLAHTPTRRNITPRKDRSRRVSDF